MRSEQRGGAVPGLTCPRALGSPCKVEAGEQPDQRLQEGGRSGEEQGERSGVTEEASA